MRRNLPYPGTRQGESIFKMAFKFIKATVGVRVKLVILLLGLSACESLIGNHFSDVHSSVILRSWWLGSLTNGYSPASWALWSKRISREQPQNPTDVLREHSRRLQLVCQAMEGLAQLFLFWALKQCTAKVFFFCCCLFVLAITIIFSNSTTTGSTLPVVEGWPWLVQSTNLNNSDWPQMKGSLSKP